MVCGLIALSRAASAQSVEELQHMSLEDLANIEISSVSKSAEPLSDAPAAIYVITHDDIIRSGLTSLPEILRLAPNLQVARVTGDSYAISARGFNGTAASKLLVLIDGRSVYTPFHNGVSWDLQDVLPEDIERIEVISGPGATLWGANAVNGVINIITRKSSDTQGGVLQLGGGNLERRASVQYGGTVGPEVSYRAYLEGFYDEASVTATGANAHDNWWKPQAGFRVDWTPAPDLITLQGDYYRGSEAELSQPNETITGHNLTARWTHVLGDGSQLQIQGYYDYICEKEPGVASDTLATYDLDVQHSFAWGERQQIVWGGGYRIENDDFPTILSATQPLYFSPQQRSLGLGNAFVQDTITLTDRLKLTLGTKLEVEPYTGLEPLPSGRLSWKVSDTTLVWAAISRAVRAPSRLDRDLFEKLGNFVVIQGGNFQPEKLIAYELGFRAQPDPRWSFSVSSYYNVYRDLRTAEYVMDTHLPIEFANRMQGDTYGTEVWTSYRINGWWRLDASASWLHKNLRFLSGSLGLGGVAIAGDDPTYQASIRSSMDIVSGVTLDLDLRKVGALPDPASPTYTELDGNVGWAVSPRLQVSLTGQNLLHAHHLEFGSTTAPLQLGAVGVETGRSVFLDTRWRF